MQENKRVYPRERTPAKWMSYLLLFLSAVVILSGIAGKGMDAPMIEAVATPTPISLEEAFDETIATREVSLSGATWYALQLGAFENEDSAKELAEIFIQRGAAGYIWQDERYRTLAAIYPSKEDAQNVRQQLLDQHTIESYLYEIPLPSLTLRMKGMVGQIDILEAAFLHAKDLILQLHELSVEMDRQEKNSEEAYEVIMALKSQMELVKLRLEQRFSAPRNAAVEALIHLFDDYSAFCDGMDKESSTVLLGQQIKHQAIHTLEATKKMMDALGNT